VQASEALVGLLDGRGHGGLVRDIQRERQDLVAVGGDQVGQGIDVAGGRCDLVAAGQCRLDEPAAEATGGTCDEPDLAHRSTPLDVSGETAINPSRSSWVSCPAWRRRARRTSPALACRRWALRGGREETQAPATLLRPRRPRRRSCRPGIRGRRRSARRYWWRSQV